MWTDFAAPFGLRTLLAGANRRFNGGGCTRCARRESGVVSRERLQERLGPIQPLMIRSNRDIQNRTLEIFDRTFTITNVLRLLAILVAVVGVLSALLALHLERARSLVRCAPPV